MFCGAVIPWAKTNENVFEFNNGERKTKQLSSVALMSIERKCYSQMLEHDIDKIIDVFGRRKNRNFKFFKLTSNV